MNYAPVPITYDITETSVDRTRKFKLNEAEYKLYSDAKEANRTSFVSSGTLGFLLICSFLFIVVLFILNWIFKLNRINEYLYYIFIWIVILLYLLYESNMLYNKSVDLNDKIEKIISDKEYRDYN